MSIALFKAALHLFHFPLTFSDVAIECFEKTKKNLPLMPLQSLKNFTILYCGTKPNTVIPRQSRSVSPAKENQSADKPRLIPTGSLKRASSPTRTGQRNFTQSTPLYQPNQRRLSEKNDSASSGVASSGTSSAKTGTSNKTMTTAIGVAQTRPKTETDKKVIPIVCKEASKDNKLTSSDKTDENDNQNSSEQSDKSENESKDVEQKEKTDEPETSEPEPKVNKPTTVVVDTLTKTTDSLNQATTALGRLSITLNQVGLADSLLEEVRLKMTHAESQNNATVAKPNSAHSTSRDRENLERGN